MLHPITCYTLGSEKADGSCRKIPIVLDPPVQAAGAGREEWAATGWLVGARAARPGMGDLGP